MTISKSLPRGIHKKGSKPFNTIRTLYIKARRKEIEKSAREQITVHVNEIKNEIHAIEVSDNNISLFDKDNKIIIIIK